MVFPFRHIENIVSISEALNLLDAILEYIFQILEGDFLRSMGLAVLQNREKGKDACHAKGLLQSCMERHQAI